MVTVVLTSLVEVEDETSLHITIEAESNAHAAVLIGKIMDHSKWSINCVFSDEESIKLTIPLMRNPVLSAFEVGELKAIAMADSAHPNGTRTVFYQEDNLPPSTFRTENENILKQFLEEDR